MYCRCHAHLYKNTYKTTDKPSESDDKMRLDHITVTVDWLEHCRQPERLETITSACTMRILEAMNNLQ